MAAVPLVVPALPLVEHRGFLSVCIRVLESDFVVVKKNFELN